MAVGSLKRSSIAAYTKYDSMLAGNTFTPTTFDYEHLGTTVLSSSQASVTFTLPSNAATEYKHLQIRFATRNNYNDASADMYMRINGDATASNYTYHSLYGTGSIAGSETQLNSPTGARFAQSAGATFTSGVYFAGISDILDFSSSTKNKVVRTFSGNTGTYNRNWLSSNLWMSTAVITSLTFVTSVGASFIAGSRFSIYGVKG